MIAADAPIGATVVDDIGRRLRVDGSVPGTDWFTPLVRTTHLDAYCINPGHHHVHLVPDAVVELADAGVVS